MQNNLEFTGYMKAFLDAEKAIINELKTVTNEDTRQALLTVHRKMQEKKREFIYGKEEGNEG